MFTKLSVFCCTSNNCSDPCCDSNGQQNSQQSSSTACFSVLAPIGPCALPAAGITAVGLLAITAPSWVVTVGSLATFIATEAFCAGINLIAIDRARNNIEKKYGCGPTLVQSRFFSCCIKGESDRGELLNTNKHAPSTTKKTPGNEPLLSPGEEQTPNRASAVPTMAN